MQISEEYNSAILITNQVMADPSGGMTFVQDPKKPIGGHVLAHASTVRISLRKGKGEQRVAKIVDHPCMRAPPHILLLGSAVRVGGATAAAFWSTCHIFGRH